MRGMANPPIDINDSLRMYTNDEIRMYNFERISHNILG